MTQDEQMRKNAMLFDAFCLRAENRGLRVGVALSGSGVAEMDGPPHDLVIRVVSRDTTTRDPVSLSERVTTMAATLSLLEAQIGMRPL